MGASVGIDLGTTKCVVAVAGAPGDFGRVLRNKFGETETPSIVAEDSNGQIIVGRGATNLRRHEAITCAKRYLGENKTFLLPRRGAVHARDVVSFLLEDLKRTAERELGDEVDGATIGVPFYCNSRMVSEFREAAAQAGFFRIQLVAEPVAAVMASYTADDPRTPQRVLTYDLGGGKFEAAVVEIRDGQFTVRCGTGDANIGGCEFDGRLAKWFWEQLRADGYDLPGAPETPDDQVFALLLQQAEQAKIRLSFNASWEVRTPLIVQDRSGQPHVVEARIDRAEFEQIIAPDVYRTVDLCRQMLDREHLTVDELDDVLLVGGSSRIPFVRQEFQKAFCREPRKTHPQHCVALGAARLAARSIDIESDDSPSIVSVVTPYAIAMQISAGFKEIVPAGMQLPFQTTLEMVVADDLADSDIQLPLFEDGKPLGVLVVGVPQNVRSSSPVLITFTIDTERRISAEVYFPEFDQTHNVDLKAPNSISQLTQPKLKEIMELSKRIREKILKKSIGTPTEWWCPSLPEFPGSDVDCVQFSVTSPTSVQPGVTFILDVWAHLEQQRTLVLERAKQAYGGREVQMRSIGPVEVSRRTVLGVRLSIEGLDVANADATILWVGEIGNAQFEVKVPHDSALKECVGVAFIYVDGLRTQELRFIIGIAEKVGNATTLPLEHRRYERAFASYASEDRDKVLGRLQGMQKRSPSLEIFLDVLALRSGQNWEHELYREIARSDVFYLFWSNYARESEWVDREWHCALERRGIDFIDPVPLVDPKDVPPPPELASKHFNDWVLAFRKRP